MNDITTRFRMAVALGVIGSALSFIFFPLGWPLFLGQMPSCGIKNFFYQSFVFCLRAELIYNDYRCFCLLISNISLANLYQ